MRSFKSKVAKNGIVNHCISSDEELQCSGSKSRETQAIANARVKKCGTGEYGKDLGVADVSQNFEDECQRRVSTPIKSSNGLSHPV